MRRIAAFIAAAWLATGCLSPHGVVVADVATREWDDTVRLAIPNEDTLSRRSINLVVRYDGRLSADTLPLELTFTSPDSLRTTERVSFRIPHYRTPSPLAHEVEIPYRTGVLLSRRGDYSLVIVPCFPIAGILSVGVNVR